MIEYQLPTAAFTPAPEAVRTKTNITQLTPEVSSKLTGILNGLQSASGLGADDTGTKTFETAWTVASVASSAAGAYHGYKRNKSVGWAIWWALMGGIFPIITPAIAVAQGFGKEKNADSKGNR